MCNISLFPLVIEIINYIYIYSYIIYILYDLNIFHWSKRKWKSVSVALINISFGYVSQLIRIDVRSATNTISYCNWTHCYYCAISVTCLYTSEELGTLMVISWPQPVCQQVQRKRNYLGNTYNIRGLIAPYLISFVEWN